MITIYDWFGYDLPIQERYRLIKEAGFDGVMMWWSNYLDRNEYRKAPQLAREADLLIENIHTPFQIQDDIWLDNLDGDAAMDCYLQNIADCAEFQIPTMVIHLPDEDKPSNALGLKRFQKIAEKAEKLGVYVALENLHNLANLAYLFEQLNSCRIGFCYDSSHHHRFYPNSDLLSMFGSRLLALHLHDYIDVQGQYITHRLPFDGIIDWSATIKKISKTGYTGATAIEAMNWSYESLSIEEFLQEAYQRAKKLESLRNCISGEQ
jgi:sugar phosphate isomerase/epimerase